MFTDTIRANFDNFNSKLSIPINIKNYDDINISKVENYYCNGNSLTFQPHIYNYKIAYWRVVKSIEIEISGQSDDYAQVIVNNSITVHPNLQDTLGIKDGIYIWGKTQSSDYVKEKHPFTMTNENLNIQFGTVNTLPTVCYLKASLKIRLFFQFTDTIKVLCNNASKQILISKPFTAPTSTSERCRQYGYYYGIPIDDFVGSSGAASLTKTFTASDFLYSEHIKKYEVKFACGNGTCVFRINGEIKYNKTMCQTCPDRSSGITVTMPVTISSTSTLRIGFAQSAFRVCAFYQFTGTVNLVSTSTIAVIEKVVDVFYPVKVSVQNNLPGVMPAKYPGSGSHYGSYLAKYSSVSLYGLPNTPYYFKIVAITNNFDSGLVKGTIDNWTRIFESNRGEGGFCSNSDLVGTECYIGNNFNRYIDLITDNTGFISLLFLHCGHVKEHDLYINLEIYEKRREKYAKITSAYVYVDH